MLLVRGPVGTKSCWDTRPASWGSCLQDSSQSNGSEVGKGSSRGTGVGWCIFAMVRLERKGGYGVWIEDWGLVGWVELTSWKILPGTKSERSACQQLLLSVESQSVKKQKGVGAGKWAGLSRACIFIVYTVFLVECNIFTGLYTSENGFT